MITLVATCLFGLEKQLGEEIDALGCQRIETIDGRVSFRATPADIPRANIALRTAERVYLSLGSFPAKSFTELFDGVRALPFEEYIGKEDAFPVKGHAIKSQLFSVPDCQSIVKKAIVERLSSVYGIKWFSEKGVKNQIEFFIFKDVATLMIDTSGVALHKRGYRPAAGIAPLRETLAAAMVLSSRPRPDTLIHDPFCGSGTIVIEAALILRNIAPGLGREFAAEQFAWLPRALWREAREEARDKIRRDITVQLRGTDIDPKVLALARENALRAGVAEDIAFAVADARHIEKPTPTTRGTVICNPPYGERMMEIEEAEHLYRELGPAFARLAPWQIYVLTSHQSFERLFGRRADKIKRLYNGMIPCQLYQFFKPVEWQKKR